MNGDHTNAVAGPSTLYTALIPSSPHSQVHSPASSHTPPPATALAPPPLLFLPPPAPPPPKQHLASTQDLLARFHLLPAYDKYVRPALLPGSDPDGAVPSTPGPTTPGVDKGKGREMGGGMGNMNTPGGDEGDGGDGDDEEGGGKGEKKKKNTYKHLIKGVPGKHSLKKDDYLTTMMLVPPKQRMRITPFDLKTQEDAFAVSLEGLKGWNINALVLESAQAREDRKKRKELKRLAKMQQQQVGVLPSLISGSISGGTPIVQPQPQQHQQHQQQHQQPIQAPIPTPAGAGGAGAGVGVGAAAMRRTSTATATSTPTLKSSGTPRPGSAVPPGAAGGGAGGGRPASTVPRPGSAVPRPGSAVPRPGSAMMKQQGMGQGMGQVKQQVGTPVRMGTPMNVDQQQRGKKREREELGVNGAGGGGVNGVSHYGASPGATNGHANGNGMANGNGNGHGSGGGTPKVVMNAKAGTGNIRPRPIKKQRMDVQGQARDVSAPVQQQPTPQGV